MHKPANHSAAELLTILSARQLEDGQVVFAGVGIPLLAATLAQRLRCPGLTILFEGGVIGAFIEPGKLPPSTNDQRCTKRANMVLGSAEVLLLPCQVVRAGRRLLDQRVQWNPWVDGLCRAVTVLCQRRFS